MLGALPGVRCTVPEASYLMWVDVTDALPEGTAAAEHLLAHGVALSNGADFGATPGYVRANLACTRETLERGLQRVREALKTE